MPDFNINDYKPEKYSNLIEDYTFFFDGIPYKGHTYAYDEDSDFFKVLDYGQNFLDTLRTYYKQLLKRDLPEAKLFLIERQGINAFAVYEESLKCYCIGIFLGVCQEIKENIKSSFDKLVGNLIPEDKKDARYERIFLEAIRFFVAHEYAHIICGHEKEKANGVYFEYLEDGERSEEENLFQQMKEFQADQMAMAFLCGLAYQDNNNRKLLAMRQREEEFRKSLGDLPERLKNELIFSELEKSREITDLFFSAQTLEELQLIMGGINVIFYTLDSIRKAMLEKYADEQNISQEEQESFYFRSGLSAIRKSGHPLPSIRLDAVIRIMDENIERNEPEARVELYCRSVADFVWKVEISRNEDDLGALYCHIAHTPTAQDFIQEMEMLWQEKKNVFEPYLPPLERLFYANRIVDMTDEGELSFYK